MRRKGDRLVLKSLLAHPRTRGLDIDDPGTTDLRRQIIREKRVLRGVYHRWYTELAKHVPDTDAWALELGSGAGHMDRHVPRLIRSDVFDCSGLDLVADARQLPLADQSLRAILMVDVLHHIPSVERFFTEAARCLEPGGVMAMVEPWNTAWARWVYQNLHHEPFRPDADSWTFPSSGPLSGANGALPWIVLERDRARFEREHPGWSVQRLEPIMPLRYLVSGGVSLRSLWPGVAEPALVAFERVLSPWRHRLGMFAVIVLRREA